MTPSSGDRSRYAMRADNPRWLLLAALLLVVYGIVQLRPDEGGRVETGSRLARDAGPAGAGFGPAGRADTAAPSSAAAAAPAASPGGSAIAANLPGASPATDQARFRLQVRAPPDARVGDVFAVHVDLEGDRAVREFRFAMTWDKRHLALVGWSPGTLAQPGGAPVEIGAEEPSDGNVEVTLAAGNGGAVGGTGGLVVFQLQALKAGSSAIAVRNATAFDAAGAADANVAVIREGRVTIR